MFKFISNAFKELSHVVWPTPKETRTYMYYNLVIIVVMTIFLALVGYGFRTILQQTKYLVNPSSQITTEDIDAANALLQSQGHQSNLEAFGLTGTTLASSGITIETTTGSEDIQAVILPSETEEILTGATN